MASIDGGVRPWWVASLTSAALWTLYAGLQARNWVWQHSAFDGLLAASGEYSPPVPSPALRLVWLAGVLAALTVLTIALSRRAASNELFVTRVALASGGLLVGFVSIWLTPSKFGLGRGTYIGKPSAEFNTGVLFAIFAAAAFLTLCTALGRQRRRITTDSRVA